VVSYNAENPTSRNPGWKEADRFWAILLYCSHRMLLLVTHSDNTQVGLKTISKSSVPLKSETEEFSIHPGENL